MFGDLKWAMHARNTSRSRAKKYSPLKSWKIFILVIVRVRLAPRDYQRILQLTQALTQKCTPYRLLQETNSFGADLRTNH